MKFFLLSLFLFLSAQSALAGFIKTSFDLGATPKGKTKVIKFGYVNSGATPVIFNMEQSSSEGGVCRVSSYTTRPILPKTEGAVYVTCSFQELGAHMKQVARVNIYDGKTTSVDTLQVKALAIEQGTCHDMDLNVSSPLTKMPVLDQDGIGICYAFTSSQLVEFQLRSRGINRSLSPIDASFMVKSNSKQSEFVLTAGLVKSTVEKIIEDGVATRECVNRVIAKHTKGTSITSEEFLTIMEGIAVGRRQELSEKQIKEKLKNQCDTFGITSTGFDKLMDDLNKPFKDYLTEILSECDNEREALAPINGLVYKELARGTNQEIQYKLNQILDNRIPAAVAICAQIVQGEPNYRGGIQTTGHRNIKRDANGKKLCAAHSVLITAKRKVNNKCEYLLRNSWGGSWKQRDLVCACRTSKAYYPDCSKNTEKSGNKVMVGCWISQDNLMSNTYNVGGFAE